MRYYKIEKNEEILRIGIGWGGEEVTKDEYINLKAEIETKAKKHLEEVNNYVKNVKEKTITIEEVPSDLREEVENILKPTEAKLYTHDQYDAVLLSLIEEGRL